VESKYIIVVFRSRQQTLSFTNEIKKRNTDVKVINTPHEVKIGCGLSARIEEKDYNKAKDIIKKHNYTAFVGFYSIKYQGTKVIVDKMFSIK
jgi:hypothetical protein